MGGLVEQFETKIDEVGARRALDWLKTQVSDPMVVQTAKLWSDDIDNPTGKAVFETAVRSVFGQDSSPEPKSETESGIAGLLEALLAKQDIPESLKKSTLRDYLRSLRRSMERVGSLGIKIDNTDGRAPRLEKVYVERRARVETRHFKGPRDMDGKVGEVSSRASGSGLIDALGEHPRTVIVAGPGHGKTFLFRHLCLLLTDPELGSDKEERFGFEPSVPILVSLRKFGPWTS